MEAPSITPRPTRTYTTATRVTFLRFSSARKSETLNAIWMAPVRGDCQSATEGWMRIEMPYEQEMSEVVEGPALVYLPQRGSALGGRSGNWALPADFATRPHNHRAHLKITRLV